jgi:hypothetical protein
MIRFTVRRKQNIRYFSETLQRVGEIFSVRTVQSNQSKVGFLITYSSQNQKKERSGYENPNTNSSCVSALNERQDIGTGYKSSSRRDRGENESALD